MLHARTLPFILNSGEAAVLTGLQLHELGLAVSRGLFDAALLGHPGQNSRKLFSRNSLLKLLESDQFLNRLRKTIEETWREKNAHLQAQSGGS